MLHWVYGLETREIASVLGWRPSLVRRRVGSALAQLPRVSPPPHSLAAMRERVLGRAVELGFRPAGRASQG